MLKDDAQELNRERGNTAFDAKCSEDSLWQVQIVREPQKVRPHVLEGVSKSRHIWQEDIQYIRAAIKRIILL